jgi:hypothetical protein
MGCWNPGDGISFRGDSNTHTSETPRSRAHIKAGISRLENNFGCLGELVNSLGSHCYLKPLLMRPLLTGVGIAGFTHRPGFTITIKPFQMFYFPQNFTLYLLLYPVFSLQKPCSTRLAVPRFYPHFGCSARLYWLFFTKNIFGPSFW